MAGALRRDSAPAPEAARVTRRALPWNMGTPLVQTGGKSAPHPAAKARGTSVHATEGIMAPSPGGAHRLGK
jgi:hypothetical protein